MTCWWFVVVFKGSLLLPVLVTTGSDGTLISGKNEKEHLEDLRQVLCIIQENGLHIRLDFRKYVFFKAKFSKQNFQSKIFKAKFLPIMIGTN